MGLGKMSREIPQVARMCEGIPSAALCHLQGYLVNSWGGWPSDQCGTSAGSALPSLCCGLPESQWYSLPWQETPTCSIYTDYSNMASPWQVVWGRWWWDIPAQKLVLRKLPSVAWIPSTLNWESLTPCWHMSEVSHSEDQKGIREWGTLASLLSNNSSDPW